MASNDLYPILTSAQAVSSVPAYTVDLRKALALPDPVSANFSNTQTLGTATTLSPMPSPLVTPSLNIAEQPYIGTTACRLQCMLTFGAWGVVHAGAGDIRMGARIVNNYGTEIVNYGAVSVDWTRTVSSTVSVSRTRVVTFDVNQYAGAKAELLAAISGSPTTKTVSYGYVELTPLRWVAP